ncbi:MAG TPA: Gfo/Idh/MocA family oxidoreductase [Bryobacteraceae bacterium]|nr:Gfo/Idh/MocA family oxidoreductase [Bryobacteraceae bacterium]
MKVLIVGLGGIGQRHARNLRTLLGDEVDLLAYRVRGRSHVITASLDINSARDVEAELGISAFDSLPAALGQRPDAAFICNPTSLHVPVALQCVEAGCDVLLEKPVSHSLMGIADLRKAVSAEKRIVMLGYQLRFHPCLERLREMLDDDLCGKPIAARVWVGEDLRGWHRYEDYRDMYASRAELGGGVVLSQIHELDYIYDLFGVPNRIFALGGHVSALEIDVEDVCSALLQFEINGRVLPVHLQQDYLQVPTSRGCEILCERGRISMDLVAATLVCRDACGNICESQQWSGFERNQLFVDELRHFLHCVETRERPVVDLDDGIWSLQMALAAKESLRSGCVVELPRTLDHVN